jgi:hypothetical protein
MNDPIVLVLLIAISVLLTVINLYIMYISVKILRVSEALLDETSIIRKETIKIREVSIDLKEIGFTQVDLLKQMPSVKFGAGARWFEDHEQIATAMDGKKEGTFITTSRRSSATP